MKNFQSFLDKESNVLDAYTMSLQLPKNCTIRARIREELAKDEPDEGILKELIRDGEGTLRAAR